MTQTKQVFFRNAKGKRIAGWLDSSPSMDSRNSPGILICHGMLSNKDSQKHERFAHRLAAEKFLVLRFDFSFVGESEGNLEDMTITGEVEDLESAVSFMRTHTNAPLGLIGSSMGSAVAALYAAQNPDVSAMVLMASLARPDDLSRESEALHRKRGFIDTPLGNIGLGLLEDSKQQDVLGAISKTQAAVLLIHGEADKLIPVKEAMDLFHAAGGKKSIHVIGGADHRFSENVDVEECTNLIVNWFRQYLNTEAKS